MIFQDSLDWANSIIKGPAIWETLHTKCSSGNTKPAIISNQIQFNKFKDKIPSNQKQYWLGLRLTYDGIRHFCSNLPIILSQNFWPFYIKEFMDITEKGMKYQTTLQHSRMVGLILLETTVIDIQLIQKQSPKIGVQLGQII